MKSRVGEKARVAANVASARARTDDDSKNRKQRGCSKSEQRRGAQCVGELARTQIIERRSEQTRNFAQPRRSGRGPLPQCARDNCMAREAEQGREQLPTSREVRGRPPLLRKGRTRSGEWGEGLLHLCAVEGTRLSAPSFHPWTPNELVCKYQVNRSL
jgi:hypothetical protein